MAVAYVATLLAFVGIDFVWLSLAADRLYRPILANILVEGFRFAPAAAFYLIYAAGLVVFAVRPGLAEDSLRRAALTGAFFGFCAYAVYDLTNQATLRDWATSLTLADLAWGTVLSAVSAAIGFTASRAIGR